MRLLPWEYGVRNMARSPVRLVLTSGGAALVVVLTLVAAGFVRGMRESFRMSGQPDNVMLLGAGSEESVERSEIQAGVGSILLGSVPGLRTTAGVPHVSPEVHVQLGLEERPGAGARPASIRGITPAAFLVHPRVRISEGRAPEEGADEILVGRLAASRMGLPARRLAIGETIWFDNRPWRVCGRFEAAGTVMESEIWIPLTDLQIAAKRKTLSCVIATLGAADFAAVDTFVRQRLDLELVAIRESDYYEGLSAFFAPVQAVAMVTAGLMALIGLCGGLNALYAAYVARVRELAVLQTLGFPRRAIVLSLVQESVLSAAAGALVALAAGALLLDGIAVRFSLGSFGLRIDSYVLAIGLVAGFFLGAIGALPPAWRILRLPIATALKTS